MMRNALSPNRLMIFASMCAVWFLALAAFPVLGGPEDNITADYTWTAPEYGTPVEHYIAQVMVNDVDIQTLDNIPSEFVSVVVVYGNNYRIRVAGVDADGNQGPYSEWSDPYTPEVGPPGF